MSVLTFAQTLFYFTTSIAIIVCGILFGMVIYQLIVILKHLERISNSFGDTADELKNRISEILNRLEDLPILSYFFRKKSSRGSQHNKK